MTASIGASHESDSVSPLHSGLLASGGQVSSSPTITRIARTEGAGRIVEADEPCGLVPAPDAVLGEIVHRRRDRAARAGRRGRRDLERGELRPRTRRGVVGEELHAGQDPALPSGRARPAGSPGRRTTRRSSRPARRTRSAPRCTRRWRASPRSRRWPGPPRSPTGSRRRRSDPCPPGEPASVRSSGRGAQSWRRTALLNEVEPAGDPISPVPGAASAAETSRRDSVAVTPCRGS